MTIRPGINAVRLAAALFALALLTFLTVHAVWLLLALLLLGLALSIRDYRVLRQQLPRFTVQRTVPTVIGRGDPFEVIWTVTSPPGASATGELRDEVPDVANPRLVIQTFSCRATDRPSGSKSRSHADNLAAATDTLRQQFVIPIRGRFTFGPLWLRLPGPFQFLDGQQRFDDRSSVRVLPETYASPDRFRKDLGAEIRLLDKPVFARQHGDGTEFESLKEYRPGDDPRRIDWRATARMQRPIVRRFQIERHRDVVIVIDCGRLMGGQTDRGSKLDCAVDSALLLAKVALQGGDRCGFALFDHTVRGYLAPVSGLPSMQALVDSVYDAYVDWGESDFAPLFATLQRRQAKRSLLVIVSDVLDAATSEQFRGSLRRLAQRHVVLFAALRTPLLNAVVDQPLDSFRDASRKAVTFRLLHDREEALQTLRHAGIHVLDVEPQQLTAPLINEFIAIRRRNLL
ncbi:MAG: DUF58 domain-containing protein [Planctomycetaceae bacterium]|nr:DUF58 domain-containing protein [Planctomycetaceae bacterium]